LFPLSLLCTHVFAYLDLEILVQQFKYIRSIDVEPWKPNIGREIFPGPQVKTDEDIRGIFATLEINHDYTLPPQNSLRTQSAPSGVRKFGYIIGKLFN
jgi:hypothetical protein